MGPCKILKCCVHRQIFFKTSHKKITEIECIWVWTDWPLHQGWGWHPSGRPVAPMRTVPRARRSEPRRGIQPTPIRYSTSLKYAQSHLYTSEVSGKELGPIYTERQRQDFDVKQYRSDELLFDLLIHQVGHSKYGLQSQIYLECQRCCNVNDSQCKGTLRARSH